MESILDDIRDLFASTSRGARKIKSLPKEYPAWVIKMDDGYGVCVEYDREAEKISKSDLKLYLDLSGGFNSGSQYNINHSGVNVKSISIEPSYVMSK